MQAVAGRPSPKIIVLPVRMGASPVLPPQPESRPDVEHPAHVRYGNWAQWIGLVVALSLPFILRECDRQSTQETALFNATVDNRIDAKLNPAVAAINTHIDTKFDPLQNKVDDLAERVSRLEGALTKRVSDIEKTQ